jgi:arginase
MHPGRCATRSRLGSELIAERLPVVLGGDCTIELGTLSGAIAAGHDPALVYFDLHPDLNIPSSVPDGALDWMGTAHMLDIPGAVDELAGCGSRRPLIPAARVFLYSHDPKHSTEDESTIIESLDLQGIQVDAVAADPRATAADARDWAGRTAARYLVHFDVDVIDFVDAPLSENLGRNYGLAFEAAMDALEVLLADDRVLALTVSELNPHHGAADGSTLRAFIERLARALTPPRDRLDAGRPCA